MAGRSVVISSEAEKSLGCAPVVPAKAGPSHPPREAPACPSRPRRCDIRPLRSPPPARYAGDWPGVPLRPPEKSDRMQRNPENSPRSAHGALRFRSGRAIASCCIPAAIALPFVHISVAFCPHRRCFPSASALLSVRIGVGIVSRRIARSPSPAALRGSCFRRNDGAASPGLCEGSQERESDLRPHLQPLTRPSYAKVSGWDRRVRLRPRTSSA